MKTLAGAGVYCPEIPRLNQAIRLPRDLKQSNQTEGAEHAPKTNEITFCSDSKTSIDGLTRNRKKWEDQGYINVKNSSDFKLAIARLRERQAISHMKWVKGHVGIEGNEEADKLADEGREKDEPDIINVTIPDHLQITGAKLNKMTQALAYKAIRTKKMCTKKYQEAMNRRATKYNMNEARRGAKTLSGKTPSEARIWRALRHKNLSRQIRYFLWMIAHNGYQVGRYWSNIPDCANREFCHFCKVTESMEHILTTCRGPGMEEIWSLCEDLWRGKKTEWIRPKLGEILTCGLANLKDSSAHLIWKLRNNRVINGKGFPSAREIYNKWYRAIDNRLTIDTLLTNSKFGRQRLQKSLVLLTWDGVIEGQDSLPDDWTREPGVLVSRCAGVG
ncbi:ribonuclease H-like protein [Lentinula edodes]|nr:ribonuclease H-like protein [Lentinula edodes]